MNYRQLTENERYQIYILLKAGMTKKYIALSLGRSPSTITREIGRNTGLKGYRPAQAQKLTEQRRRVAFKYRKVTDEVYGWIETLIRQELSPEQVVSYLAKHRGVSLHYETVYQLIYADKAAKGDLYTHLRIVSKPYRKRYGSYDSRGRIKHRISIDERPMVVESRSRIGDWEGDTIIGQGRQSAMLTLVERKTLYSVIVRLTGKRADLLADALIQEMQGFQSRIKTITFDNGLEFAEHRRMAEALGAKVYFAHPYSSWERGTNENTNGLIRQYFPKGTDFNTVTDKEIQHVADRLNQRPRKTRGGKSPNELFLGRRVDLLAA
jgi:IS30 family transposase